MPNIPLIQSEAQKWQQRIAMLTNAGLPPGPVTELAKTDLLRISQGGGTLPEDQITSMVHSAYTGQVLTPSPPSHGSGADWNPLSIAANVGKDLTTDIRSWPAGVLHLGADIINPHKYSEDVQDISHFKFGSISDMAKEIQAMPILGPLTPWTFALTAGASGITQHPLNFLLAVASVAAPAAKLASTGADVAEGSAMSSLQEGHPFKAALQKLGAYDPIKNTITSELDKTQFGQSAMNIWRNIHSFSRAGTAAFYGQDLKQLGIILKDPELTLDGGSAIIREAQSFNTRYESDSVKLDPSTISHAKSDPASLTTLIPTNRDLTAYLVGEVGDGLPSPHQIFLSQADALATLPEELRGKVQVSEIRVRPGDITGGGDSPLIAKDILPNRSYASTPHRLTQLEQVRKFVDEHSTLKKKLESGKGPVSVVSMDGEDLGMYPNKSAPVRRQTEYHAASDLVNSATEEVKTLSGQLSDIATATRGVTLTDLYTTAQPIILSGMQDATLRPLYDRLDQAFQSSDVRAIQSSLSSLTRALTRSGKDTAPLDAIRSQLLGINSRSAHIATNKRRAGEISAKLQAAQSRLQLAQSAADKAKKAYYRALQKRQPDRFNALVETQVRSELKNEITRQTTADIERYRVELNGQAMNVAINQSLQAFTQAMDALGDPTKTPTPEAMMGLKSSHTDRSPFIDKATFRRVQREAIRSWTDMLKAGYDPIWIHQIDPSWSHEKIYGSVHPLTRTLKPTQDRTRIFDYRPKVLDISAQLSHQAMEYRTELATNQFLDYMVNKSGAVHRADEINADMQRRFADPSLANTQLRREFTDWYNPLDPKTKYLIPKPVAKGLDSMMSGGKLGGPIGRAHRAGMNVFKVAVLSGPRHMVHVGVGGLVQVALGAEHPLSTIAELAHPKVLFDIIHGKGVPAELSTFESRINEAVSSGQLFKGAYEELPDQLHAYRGGNKLGQWFRQSMIGRGIHSAEDHIATVENITTDMFRAATYLDKLKRTGDNEAAIALANKVLIDVDNLAPFEQTVVRQIYPFYTFTKHILRYILTYPADHPLRAAILSQLAQHIEDTNQSGDPGRLSKLFFLGKPDALGKVDSVDFSNVNPFRSMSSVFSMAGFLSGLAPEFQAGLKAFGINTLTGAPALFSNYTYDQYSGTNIAKRPGLNPFDFVTAYIPQAEILDHYLLLTDSMRQLKASNPEAYARSLMSEMNLPFTIAPININDVRAKAAAMQYRDAQTAVTDAMRTGDTSTLRQFVAVPFQGRLYPSSSIANYIDYYNHLYGGKISPKAVALKPRVPKAKGLLHG